jgi:hypothetical protein
MLRSGTGESADMSWDIDLDGAVTISDIWLFAKGIFLLPGNIAIEVLTAPDFKSFATFFHVTMEDRNGGWAIAISIVFWVIALSIVANLIAER